MSTRAAREKSQVEPARALSVERAADIAAQSVPTIRRAIRRRELPHCRIGRRVVVLEEDLYRYLRDRRVSA
jgi:excisionase family DNA binding protein